MASTKYSDIIRIRGGKGAYNILEEKSEDWETFIPNQQFNDVLKTVINAVRGTNIDTHKSFWINGTYGTGKSHAASVISHLLGDPVENIRRWVDYEYKDAKFDFWRNGIYAIRQTKRLLPVRLNQLNNLTHVSELAPLLQTKVVEALNNENIELEIDTDYDCLIAHIQENEVIWNDRIQRNADLASTVSDRSMLIKKLQMKDAGTLKMCREALREANIMIMIDQAGIENWLADVQTKLRETNSGFSGLLIMWDEFTDVMNDTIGISVLKALQGVAEKFADIENDTFIFLISHPSAFDRIGAEATKQTDGRYHRMKYNMEPVSAFTIMSRKFEVIDEMMHNALREVFFAQHPDLIARYTAKSNDPEATKKDLLNLFPLHPGTAHLATYYATTVGSSSRSVFEFLGDNQAMRDFLDDEFAYANRDTITADFLWDHVLSALQEDVMNYGVVLDRFHTYQQRAEHAGEAANAVFKSLLLLNAFNNIASNKNESPDPNVVPSEENLRALYEGTKYEPALDEALQWVNDGVIQRSPDGLFSVQFAALPTREVEELKETLTNGEYQYTSAVLNLGTTAEEAIRKATKMTIRQVSFNFFSEDSNESVLKNRIKSKKRESKKSDLYLALLFGRDNNEQAQLRTYAEKWNLELEQDKELQDVVFIVFDTVLGANNYRRFIEYMASAGAASKHNFMDQAEKHRKDAIGTVKTWVDEALRGNVNIMFNGKKIQASAKRLASTLNDEIAPVIFTAGPDAVDILRKKAPTTFWKPQVSKEMIRSFIFGTSKQDILTLNAVMRPVQYLLQDAVEDNLTWKPGTEDHPFRRVFDFVNSTIKNFISHGKTSELFDFTSRFDALTQPPFGLSANYASAAALAYAFRPWVNKIYDQVGKPRTADNLADDVASLIAYWDKGKSAKLSFKFQTPEEGRLSKDLIDLFKLNQLQGYNDISSLKDAKYAITGVFIEKIAYPLWSLKYLTDDFIQLPPKLTMNDKMKQLISNLVDISEDKDQRNVQLVTTTLALIGELRSDFKDIVKKPGAFRNGFENFLMSDTDVNLKQDELEDAIDFIRKNLQSTVGFWSEDEVTRQLLVWRAKQAQPPVPPVTPGGGGSGSGPNPPYNPPYNPSTSGVDVSKKKMKARELIDNTNDADELRAILDKVIDLGFVAVLDIITGEYND